MVASSPDRTIIGAIDFLADFGGVPVDRDVVTFDFALIVMLFHNTGPPSAPRPLNGVEKRRARMGASGKNGHRNPTRCERTMSPLQVASSCSLAGFLFSCQPHRRGEQFLFVHSEHHFGVLRAFYVTLRR
jgi:hypothetical protein